MHCKSELACQSYRVRVVVVKIEFHDIDRSTEFRGILLREVPTGSTENDKGLNSVEHVL